MKSIANPAIYTGTRKARYCKPAWTGYVLHCASNSYYVGISYDVERRLHEHFNGSGTKFTRHFQPGAILEIYSARSKRKAQNWEQDTFYQLAHRHPDCYIGGNKVRIQGAKWWDGYSRNTHKFTVPY